LQWCVGGKSRHLTYPRYQSERGGDQELFYKEMEEKFWGEIGEGECSERGEK